jgi:hypothetical protein
MRLRIRVESAIVSSPNATTGSWPVGFSSFSFVILAYLCSYGRPAS